jgi:hypothetical protein
MSFDRGREKKLIVAFHFQYSDQASWRCDVCRSNGLERKRRCGFLPIEDRRTDTVVWAKNGVLAPSCPRSYITAQSLAWIEQFLLWKLAGRGDYLKINARMADAFSVLESEVTKVRQPMGGRDRYDK